MSKKVTKVLAVLLVGMIFVLSSCGGPQARKKRSMKKSCSSKKSCSLKKFCGRKVRLTGSDLSAWKQIKSDWKKDIGPWRVVGDAFLNPENEKYLATKPGTGVMVNGDKGRSTHLLSKAEFGDIKAHVEYMVAKKSNSGVYFMGRYEIQILDSYGKDKPSVHDNGAIYQRWDEKRTPKGYEGKAPRVNASLPAGQWQKLDVIFRAPRFDENGKKIANAKFEKVVLNGILIHENEEVTGPTRAAYYARGAKKPTGPIFLQGEHGPVAYRNIWIVPLED